MNILAGMSGLKAAADMTRALRDGLKAGTVKPDEIGGRIGEIYDYIIDSKDALVTAKEDLDTLKEQIKGLRDTSDLAARLDYDGKVYWLPNGDKWEGPFCPHCWDADKQLVRLDHQRTRYADPLDASFHCHVHKHNITTRARPNVVSRQPPQSNML
jgi:hypothetical protein